MRESETSNGGLHGFAARAHTRAGLAAAAIIALAAPVAAIADHYGQDPKLKGPGTVTPGERVTFHAKAFGKDWAHEITKVGLFFEPRRHRNASVISVVNKSKWASQAKKKRRAKLSFRFPTKYEALVDIQTGPETFTYRDGDRVKVTLYAYGGRDHANPWTDSRMVTVRSD